MEEVSTFENGSAEIIDVVLSRRGIRKYLDNHSSKLWHHTLLAVRLRDMLSLYGSMLQLSIASAGGIGGIAEGSLSMQSVGFIGAISVTMGIILAAVSFRRYLNRRMLYESS